MPTKKREAAPRKTAKQAADDAAKRSAASRKPAPSKAPAKELDTDLIHADDTELASPVTLAHLRKKAAELRDAKKRVKDLEETLEQAQKYVTGLETKELPDLLAEAKMKNLTVEAEGNEPAFTITRSPFYRAVMPEESGPGFTWLEDNGHGDIIKRVFTIKLPMDREDMADKLKKFLEKHVYVWEVKETVPWSTLTAFVKEQVEKGESVPLDILGAFVGEIVKIKPVKEK